MMRLNGMLHAHTKKQIGYLDCMFKVMESFNMSMESVLNKLGVVGLKYNQKVCRSCWFKV